MTGKPMSSFRDAQRPTKIYIDGFRIDNIETPKLCDNIKEVALTAKVKALLEEEGKVVSKIHPVPNINPRFIMILTET